MSTLPVKKVEVTNVYRRNERSKARFIANIGGARSSKSYSIAQLFVRRLLSRRNRKALVSRKTFPALRITAYKLIVEMLIDHGVYSLLHHDKVANVITCPWTNSSITFLSIDDPEKIKSTEFNDIWLEEASEFTWEDWQIIRTRLSGRTTPEQPNQVFFSLNPSDEQSWINQRIILDPSFGDRLEVIHSSYKDNPFLDPEYVRDLEDLEKQDPNSWRIYGLGLWGMLTNLIYQPYEILKEFPETFNDEFYGLDFGFNHPTALIHVGLPKEPRVGYLRQKIYQTNLTNGMLIDLLGEIIPKDRRGVPIYADCEDPNRIEEIFNAGFNIHAAEKGPGSVKFGIDLCKRWKFYSLAENVDVNKERAGYRWRTDKNGNILEEPVKFLDHAMDAIRYGVSMHTLQVQPGYA